MRAIASTPEQVGFHLIVLMQRSKGNDQFWCTITQHLCSDKRRVLLKMKKFVDADVPSDYSKEEEPTPPVPRTVLTTDCARIRCPQEM
jgi:hypothetical protein